MTAMMKKVIDGEGAMMTLGGQMLLAGVMALGAMACAEDDGQGMHNVPGETTPQALVSSYTGEATGDVTASLSGDAVLANVAPGDKLTVILTPDEESFIDNTTDTRILFDIKAAGSGQTGEFTGVTQATVSVRIPDDGEGDCGSSSHTITLDKNGADGVAGAFDLSVLCTGSEGTKSYNLAGTFTRNLPPE